MAHTLFLQGFLLEPQEQDLPQNTPAVLDLHEQDVASSESFTL